MSTYCKHGEYKDQCPECSKRGGFNLNYVQHVPPERSVLALLGELLPVAIGHAVNRQIDAEENGDVEGAKISKEDVELLEAALRYVDRHFGGRYFAVYPGGRGEE